MIAIRSQCCVKVLNKYILVLIKYLTTKKEICKNLRTQAGVLNETRINKSYHWGLVFYL